MDQIHFFINWANPNHEIFTKIADLQISVVADNTNNLPIPTGKPPLEVVLPEGTKEVRFSFMVSGKTTSARTGGNKPMMLFAVQEYTVQGSALKPKGEPHQLIDTKALMAITSKVAVQADVRTEFVDYTPYWFDLVKRPAGVNDPGSGECYDEDDAIEDPIGNSTLFCLAFTGGDPPLWFVSVPQPARTAAPPISVFNFFRPTGPYAYTSADLMNFKKHNMFAFTRFSLRPNNAASSGHTAWDFFHDGWIALRAGMEEAVRNSGRAMVLVNPWPSAENFGKSATGELPDLCEQILRLLWSMGKVSAGHPKISMGRFGIGGFSAGGIPLVSAFNAQFKRIHEVYAFDAETIGVLGPKMVQWAGLGDRRFHGTGSNQVLSTNGIVESIRRVVDKSEHSHFTAWPPATTAAEIEAEWKASAWWDYVNHEVNFRTNGKARHQFCMFGGLEKPKTWFELFLEDSKF